MPERQAAGRVSIPKIIWQTYKSPTLPGVARPCVRSWKRQNPSWRYEFHDDQSIADFVRQNSSELEYSVFCNLPLAVMKADFWRYLVLLKYGGVYADIDTTAKVPIEHWADGTRGLVTGVENTHDLELFCQWVIAAVPEHPVLQHAIDLIVERGKDKIDLRDPLAIHYYTGPLLWTDAITSFLDRQNADRSQNTRFVRSNPGRAQAILNTPQLWRSEDIHIHPHSTLSKDAVLHMLASMRWTKMSGYDSWRTLKEKHCHDVAAKLPT